MRCVTGLVVAIALSIGSASAQQAAPNPIMDHYRAYTAALQRGDMAAAEVSAAAALAASEARDGEGGRTPVLVMNLAQVRVNSGRLAEAVAPARRAMGFAEAGVEGFDPLSVRLVLGQAELSQGGRGPGQRLLYLLNEARAAGGRDSQVYLAASVLGNWATGQRFYEDSIAAWTIAIELTQQGDASGVVARANALVGRGLAHLLSDDIDYVGGSSDTNTRDEPEGLAELDYAEALRILRPQAAQTPNGPALTQTQQLFATALAWSSVLRGRLLTLGYEDPAPLRNANGPVVSLNGAAPMCAQRLQRDPRPQAPSMALEDNFGVASAVVRVVTNEEGEIVERGVIASAGGSVYRNNVERVLPRWRVVRDGEENGSCSRASVMIVPDFFYIVRRFD